ncbi:MAG: hypothetical protein QN229_00280 [Desulfurococcaceae archaeon TW002]
MGAEVLEVLNNILAPLQNLGTSSLATVLAVIGITLIILVGLGYAVYGLIKLGKLLFSMRVKEFSLVMLGLGIVFLVVAIIMP